MMPTLLLVGLTGPASAADHLGWDWSRTHRYYIGVQVQLPTSEWIATQYNHEARISAYDLQLVTTCSDAQVESRHVVQVDCRLDDVALSAAPLEQDVGLVQPILDQLDQSLTGAVVQLQMRDDGRINDIGLDAITHVDPRTGFINETLRLIVSRAFAGLDLSLPDDDALKSWAQYRSWLMRTPSIDGSSAGIEIVNRVRTVRDGETEITSVGRGTIAPGEGIDKYDTRLASDTAFDTRFGRISDRTWTVAGGPTASSLIAQGVAGYAYLQQGHLVALLGRDTWDVGPSVELPPTDARTAIQPGNFGGMVPH